MGSFVSLQKMMHGIIHLPWLAAVNEEKDAWALADDELVTRRSSSPDILSPANCRVHLDHRSKSLGVYDLLPQIPRVLSAMFSSAKWCMLRPWLFAVVGGLPLPETNIPGAQNDIVLISSSRARDHEPGKMKFENDYRKKDFRQLLWLSSPRSFFCQSSKQFVFISYPIRQACCCKFFLSTINSINDYVNEIIISHYLSSYLLKFLREKKFKTIWGW